MEKEEYKNNKGSNKKANDKEIPDRNAADKRPDTSPDILENLLNIDVEKVEDPGGTINAIRDELARHNYYYYIKDNPIISDAQYDRLLRNLEALEKKYPGLVTPNSPTQRIGAPLEGRL